MPLCREKFFRFSEIFVVLSLLILLVLPVLILVLLIPILILLIPILILLILLISVLILLVLVLLILILVVHDRFLPNVRLPFKNFRKVPLCRRQYAENTAPYYSAQKMRGYA